MHDIVDCIVCAHRAALFYLLFVVAHLVKKIPKFLRVCLKTFLTFFSGWSTFYRVTFSTVAEYFVIIPSIHFSYFSPANMIERVELYFTPW